MKTSVINCGLNEKRKDGLKTRNLNSFQKMNAGSYLKSLYKSILNRNNHILRQSRCTLTAVFFVQYSYHWLLPAVFTGVSRMLFITILHLSFKIKRAKNDVFRNASNSLS